MPHPNDVLFTAALGLVPPWQVRDSTFSPEASQLDLWIDFPTGSKFVCPDCGATDVPVHDTVDKKWQHLAFFQHICYLHARVPRVRCDACGVKQVQVPWARSGSGFTLLFEAVVWALSKEMPVAAIARLMKVHDTRLWRILTYYVSQALNEQDYSDVTEIAMDETSRKRGHNYVTIVADAKRKRVLYVTEGKDKEAVDRFAEDFEAHKGKTENIKEVCMDMSAAFIEATLENFENAQITYDRFHVMKLANEALDAVRREDVKDNAYLQKTRYIWLKHPDNLKEPQKQTLIDLQRINTKTVRAYHLVLNLRVYWQLAKEEAEGYLKRWYGWARRSRLEPFVKLAQTIRNHWDGVLRYHTSNATTGFLEGINSLVQAAKRKARGYRTTKNLITMIYIIAGKLHGPLPT
jgi:transposase